MDRRLGRQIDRENADTYIDKYKCRWADSYIHAYIIHREADRKTRHI